MHPDNRTIYDANWDRWSDQKVYGPASRWLRWLVARNLGYIDDSAVKHVVDVGCGQGETTAMLARLLPKAKVIGIDFSDTGIALAKKSYVLPNLTFEVDTNSRRLDVRNFELATCFEVLEHVADWEALLQRICNASSRYVMLSFPTGRMRRFEASVGHVRNFPRGTVEAFMEGAGFIKGNLFNAGFPFYSPIYRDLCDVINAGSTSLTSGQYGPTQKAISAILFGMFRYFSLTRIGDQFCGVFERP